MSSSHEYVNAIKALVLTVRNRLSKLQQSSMVTNSTSSELHLFIIDNRIKSNADFLFAFAYFHDFNGNRKKAKVKIKIKLSYDLFELSTITPNLKILSILHCL